jgi:hypothetical protein
MPEPIRRAEVDPRGSIGSSMPTRHTMLRQEQELEEWEKRIGTGDRYIQEDHGAFCVWRDRLRMAGGQPDTQLRGGTQDEG